MVTHSASRGIELEAWRIQRYDMERTAVIFPGQGSQLVGMGRDVVQTSKRARAVFDRANELLDFDLRQTCFEGPPERLERTDIQQPAVFVTSVAIWEALLEAGGRRESFSWTGGLSLGEYTALHIAGSVRFDEALRLVRRRGQLMQEAAVASPGGMVSLIGADEASARALCARARQDEVLALANFNAPGQTVISGSKGACERAVKLASEFRCSAVALAVAGAFHSPLMESVASYLKPALDETMFVAPAMPVIANVDAQKHGDAATIRDSLCRQVTQPVIWQRCIERMIEDGVGRFLEIGPGRVLTGLMRRINRGVSAIAVNKADSIPKALETLGVC